MDDGFEGNPWDGNWNDVSHNWLQETSRKAARSGTSAAYANGSDDGDFAFNSLDASDATSITIDLWVKTISTETDDILIEYYNGTSYVTIADLDALGTNRKWFNYTDTITDPAYFVSDFKIRFDGTPGSNEEVWIDDVLITKMAIINDSDNDGIENDSDNCPYDSNPSQADGDGDGIGNVCDNCPGTTNTNQLDDDFDGVGNPCDNCPQTYTTGQDQTDTDSDGKGDVCDNCIFTSNFDQLDSDSDNIGNACELKRANLDGVGIVNVIDFAKLAEDWQKTAAGLTGDINLDGTVNNDDLVQIIQHWLD